MFVPKFAPPWHLSSRGSYLLHLSGLGDPTASSVTAGLISVFLELISLSTRARWRYILRGSLPTAINYLLSDREQMWAIWNHPSDFFGNKKIHITWLKATATEPSASDKGHDIW